MIIINIVIIFIMINIMIIKRQAWEEKGFDVLIFINNINSIIIVIMIILINLKAWEEKGFDVLICPAFSFPARPPDYPAWLMPGWS